MSFSLAAMSLLVLAPHTSYCATEMKLRHQNLHLESAQPIQHNVKMSRRPAKGDYIETVSTSFYTPETTPVPFPFLTPPF